MLRSRLKNIISKSNAISNKQEVGNPFELFKKSLPIEINDNYRLEAAWKAYGSPKDYRTAIWEGLIQPIDENNVKLPSIGYNEETDEYEYLNKGKENETVAKDIRVWDNDVIPLVKELKLGGFIRVYDEEKDCWKYSKNQPQDVESFKSGGKKKIRIKTEDGGFVEIDSLDEDLKAGRKSIGKYKGVDLYMKGDGTCGPNYNGKQVPDKMENGGEIIDSFLKDGKSENNEKEEQIPSDIFELIDGDYYYWPDDDRALNFIKNNKWFRKEYKQWGNPKDGEKVLLVNRKKYKDLWYDKNKKSIINYIINTGGFSNDYPDIVGDGIPARPTGEFTEDGKELYETPDGLLYTMYKKGGELEAFKQGGQMNVIPEGSLHAHKNHMELAEKGEITHKGVPVVDNEGNLQAEVEREEWTINKDLTNDIEKWYKEYYKEDLSLKEKDELAIKCGKRITKELLHNTDDRVGLILNIEQKM